VSRLGRCWLSCLSRWTMTIDKNVRRVLIRLIRHEPGTYVFVTPNENIICMIPLHSGISSCAAGHIAMAQGRNSQLSPIYPYPLLVEGLTQSLINTLASLHLSRLRPFPIAYLGTVICIITRHHYLSYSFNPTFFNHAVFNLF